MFRKRKEVAENLASRLFDTENAIDDAINKMADLTGYMPLARGTAHLSAVVGQDAIQEASVALAKLVEARGAIVETHNRLAEARDKIGLRTTSFGAGAGGKIGQEQVDNIVPMDDMAA